MSDVASDPWSDRVRQAYDATHARLWRAIFGYTASEDIADEAVAEGFAQAIRRGEGIRDVEAWVWRSTFAIARGLLSERLSGRTVAMTEDVAIGVEEPELDLMLALQRLRPADREVLLLIDFAGWPTSDIGELLGIPAATVRVRLHRARRRMRRLLEEGTEP